MLTDDEILRLERQMTLLIAYAGDDYVVIHRGLTDPGSAPLVCSCGTTMDDGSYVIMRCRDELAVGIKTFCEACLRYELEHPPVF